MTFGEMVAAFTSLGFTVEHYRYQTTFTLVVRVAINGKAMRFAIENPDDCGFYFDVITNQWSNV